MKFADDTKLIGQENETVCSKAFRGTQAAYRNRPGTSENPQAPMKQENPLQLYRLGTICLESSFAEQDLEVLANSKLNISQQCALVSKADSLVGFINRSSTSRMSDYLTWHSLDHIWDITSSLGPFNTREMSINQVQWRFMMIKGLLHMPHEESLGFCSLEMRRF